MNGFYTISSQLLNYMVFFVNDTLRKMFTICASQVVKNLVFLSRNIHHIVTENQLDEEEQKKFSVCWLARRMVREANFEVINNPKVTLKVMYTKSVLLQDNVCDWVSEKALCMFV